MDLELFTRKRKRNSMRGSSRMGLRMDRAGHSFSQGRTWGTTTKGSSKTGFIAGRESTTGQMDRFTEVSSRTTFRMVLGLSFILMATCSWDS